LFAFLKIKIKIKIKLYIYFLEIKFYGAKNWQKPSSTQFSENGMYSPFLG
jgi:hypothetical protein